MKGLQGYIYQKNNLVPAAEISFDVSPSGKRPLIYPTVKRGNGNIRLYGDYAGALDTRYRVKILDTALEAPVVSAPTFRGAGSGKITDIVAANLAAQKIRITCLSTGVDTTHAEIALEGMMFRAKQGGTPGNALYMIVDDSTLMFTRSDFSTIKALKVGDTSLEGQEMDWDTKPLSGKLVPPDAHRIAFGQDRLHVYTQYKTFEDGVWRYYFILPLQYDVKAGVLVYFVTGGRRVTLTNGVTSETYENIVTIADFWQKVRASSSLMEAADNAIDTTRAVDSPAVREFAAKTDAYFLPSYKGDGSSQYADELNAIWVTNSAKTELLEIMCTDVSFVGSEIWNVRGSSSGQLGQARSGDPASFGFLGFTVPQKLPKNWGVVKEDWSHKVQYVSRGVTPPPICFKMRLGINSSPKTLSLVYTKRPKDCNCPPASFSDRCLGFEVKEGGEIGMYTVPDLLFWTDARIEKYREEWAPGSDLGDEATEGRSGAVTKGSWYNLLSNFDKATRDYVGNFKTLAQRIMALPEDNPSALQSMVDAYKALVASLTVSQLTHVYDQSGFDLIDSVTYDSAGYLSLTETVLEYERTYGVKKNSINAAGTCYIDDPSADYYWEVRGDKAYLPAFTDTYYFSTVKSGDEYSNAKEFAFLIMTPCGGALLEGDTIEVTIGGIKIENTYQPGDIIYLPTVARQSLKLTGGVDGNDLYTFEVKGETDSFPDYLLSRSAPERYYNPHLSFMIGNGIIPFSVGDEFNIAIEGGRFIFQKDGGDWSGPLPIRQEIQPLDSGLQIAFDFGTSPSFMQNDAWEILCLQDNKAANMITPWDERAKGTGDIVFSFPEAVTIDTLVIDRHDFSGTIRFQASDDEDFDDLIHDEAITAAPLICKLYIEPAGDPPVAGITAKHFRIVATGEHSVGHVWLGNILRLDGDADGIRPLTKYAITRTTGKKPFSLFEAMQKGFTVEHSSYIENPDWESLDELISYLKTNNDMPLYFLANTDYPEECLRGRIEMDSVEPGSKKDHNLPKEHRIYSISLRVLGC